MNTTTRDPQDCNQDHDYRANAGEEHPSAVTGLIMAMGLALAAATFIAVNLERFV